MRLQTDTLRVMGRAGRPVVNLQGLRSVPESAEEPEGFEVVQASDTSVIVYGGPAVRLAHGTDYPVPMLLDDDATGYNPSDGFKTLSGITQTGHVLAALEDNGLYAGAGEDTGGRDTGGTGSDYGYVKGLVHSLALPAFRVGTLALMPSISCGTTCA